MKTARVLVILTLCLSLLAPLAYGQDLGKQLVGKWKGEKDFMTFTADGKITVSEGDLSLSGTYKVLDGQTVAIELTSKDGNISVKAKVVISGDTLSFTPEGDKTFQYKRTK